MLVCHFIAEMGIGVFDAVKEINSCHPRGDLIEDPTLNTLDSRSETSGMTASNTCGIATLSPHLSTRTKSALTKTGMNEVFTYYLHGFQSKRCIARWSWCSLFLWLLPLS